MKIGFDVNEKGEIVAVRDIESGRRISNVTEIIYSIRADTAPYGEFTLKFLCEELLLPNGYQVETDECRAVPVPGMNLMFLTTQVSSDDSYD